VRFFSGDGSVVLGGWERCFSCDGSDDLGVSGACFQQIFEMIITRLDVIDHWLSSFNEFGTMLNIKFN